MVDGIRPIPGIMSGPLGLEVTDSKSSKLNWKTVTKGKRSRKLVTRNLNGSSKLASESPVRVVDFSGSDSEKHVETAVCVPIKKRSYMLRSPSPPLQASSQEPASLPNDREPCSYNNGGSLDAACDDDKVDADFVKKAVDEGSSVIERCHTSGSSIPAGGRASCSAPEYLCQKDLSLLEHEESQFPSVAPSAVQIGDQLKQGLTTRSLSPEVHTLHQDFCTLVEACEEHESSLNSIQKRKVHSEEECLLKLEAKDAVNDVNHMSHRPPDETTTSVGLNAYGNDGMAIHLSDDGVCSLESTVLKNSEHQKILLEAPACKNAIQMIQDEHSRDTQDLPENRISFRDREFGETANTPTLEKSGTVVEDPSHVFGKDEKMCSSDVSTEGRFALDPGSEDPIIQPDNDLVSSKEGRTVSSLQDSIKIYDDSQTLDVSKNEDLAQLDGATNRCELSVDYDSPYEDGELRGSALYSGEGREYGFVDYESDGRVGDDLKSADCPGSDTFQATGKKYSSAVQISENSWEGGLGFNRGLEENIGKIENDGKKGSNLGSGITDELSSPVIVGKYDGTTRSIGHFDHNVGESYVEETGSKVTNGKLQPFTEGHVSGNRGAVYAPHNRSGVVGISRSERERSPDRGVKRYRYSSNEYRHIEGNRRPSYWDSRHLNQSNFRNADHIRSGSAIDRPYEDQPKGNRGPFCRRSPVNVVDFSGSGREVANIRRRESSRNFFGGHFSGLRDGDDDQVFDDAESTPYMRYGSTHRGRSSTPLRHIIPSSRKGHLRLRSRSPTWQPHQDRKLVPKRHIGSPEHRSESFMERRVPFQKPKFTADRGENFASSPRGRRLHMHSNERDFLTHPMRHQKSPVDTFRQSQRSDALPGRFESEDHYRPVRRSGSYLLPDGAYSRDNLEENCTRSRHDERPRRMYSEQHSGARISPLHSRPLRHDTFGNGGPNNEKDVYRRGPPDFAGDYRGSFLSPPRGQRSPSLGSRWAGERKLIDSPSRRRRSSPGELRRTQRPDPVGFSGRLKSDDHVPPMKRPGRFPRPLQEN